LVWVCNVLLLAWHQYHLLAVVVLVLQLLLLLLEQLGAAAAAAAVVWVRCRPSSSSAVSVYCWLMHGAA
jgi:hypothetical protein